jgi:hypothetical protein
VDLGLGLGLGLADDGRGVVVALSPSPPVSVRVGVLGVTHAADQLAGTVVVEQVESSRSRS